LGQANDTPAAKWIIANSMTEAHQNKILVASYSGAYHVDTASVQAQPKSEKVTPIEWAMAENPILQRIRRFERYIEQAAEETLLEEALIYSVIYCESGGNVWAVSSKGAQGLMQLMPGTAKELNVKNSFNAKENIFGGSRYLAKMLARYNDLEKALWAYNAGPSNVDAGIMPDETRKYVQKVMSVYRQLQGVI